LSGFHPSLPFAAVVANDRFGANPVVRPRCRRGRLRLGVEFRNQLDQQPKEAVTGTIRLQKRSSPVRAETFSPSGGKGGRLRVRSTWSAGERSEGEAPKAALWPMMTSLSCRSRWFRATCGIRLSAKPRAEQRPAGAAVHRQGDDQTGRATMLRSPPVATISATADFGARPLSPPTDRPRLHRETNSRGAGGDVIAPGREGNGWPSSPADRCFATVSA
jgi:hypothetical protein